jgi:hypothetical protein
MKNLCNKKYKEKVMSNDVSNEGISNIYWKFLDELEGQFQAFMSDARAGDINKSAALRARKQSVTLRKSLKEYREVSVAHDKSYGRKTKNEIELSKEIEAI